MFGYSHEDDVAVYELLSWDLCGFRLNHSVCLNNPPPTRSKARYPRSEALGII